jgi:hypothetical protein
MAERSDPSGLTAFVAVVEFKGPTAKVIRRYITSAGKSLP